ncbi:MAG TPA: hypothetical protein PLN52_09480 [Opitutaceae bacterium]|nr:hypothetical protein [Opitutaceae bacterium]
MISPERHAEYARGYLALGLLKESSRELEKIAKNDRNLPVVLSTRIELHTQEKNWTKVITAARELTRQCPTSETGWIGWAYALREMNKIEEAFSVLSQVEKRSPSCSALVHYNLGCYLSLLGHRLLALAHLRQAFLLEPDFRSESFRDRDLEAIWADIRMIPYE